MVELTVTPFSSTLGLCHAYPSALAELLQLLRRTFSHIAEAMVMSHNKVDRAQFGDQSILNISFPGVVIISLSKTAKRTSSIAKRFLSPCARLSC